MALTRCPWCGKSEGLSKHGKREYSCNACSAIHTKKSALSVANLTEEQWAQYSKQRAERMKFPSFIPEVESSGL